jgi:hypothetical protein
MRLRLGGKARDDVGAEGHVGAQAARLPAEGDGVVAQVAALHPLQDQVVAMLQRQVQMRHQPRLRRDGQHQVFVGLDRVDGTDPEPRQVRHQPQDAHHQIAEARRARQVAAPAGQVHAGQHDLVVAAIHQPLDLVHHDARGTDRELPRPNGMMQKVQRWSQPFCTCT